MPNGAPRRHRLELGADDYKIGSLLYGDGNDDAISGKGEEGEKAPGENIWLVAATLARGRSAYGVPGLYQGHYTKRKDRKEGEPPLTDVPECLTADDLVLLRLHLAGYESHEEKAALIGKSYEATRQAWSRMISRLRGRWGARMEVRAAGHPKPAAWFVCDSEGLDVLGWACRKNFEELPEAVSQTDRLVLDVL